MRGNNNSDRDGYGFDYTNVQSYHCLYWCSESASGHFDKWYYGNLVTGFQQYRDGDLHVYTECRTMCLDDDFDCYGKSGYDTYIRCHCADLCGRCQSASDDFNEWDCGNLVAGV